MGIINFLHVAPIYEKEDEKTNYFCDTEINFNTSLTIAIAIIIYGYARARARLFVYVNVYFGKGRNTCVSSGHGKK